MDSGSADLLLIQKATSNMAASKPAAQAHSCLFSLRSWRLELVIADVGACGGGAHADTEYIKVSKMGERAALVAAIARELVNG